MVKPQENKHPIDPRSNVAKVGVYDPNKYALTDVTTTVLTDEALLPGCTPRLTQRTVGKYLRPLTRDLDEVPPRPTINELPDAVINNMVLKEKANWVDKPGANAYTIHDATRNYNMMPEMIKPPHQDVFPRSYQYELDCVKFRRRHACDGLKQTGEEKKPTGAHCRHCEDLKVPQLTPFQLAWAKDSEQKRWKEYPDLTASLSLDEIRKMMSEVGRPFRHEACIWYNKNYPLVKYECILRKFSK